MKAYIANTSVEVEEKDGKHYLIEQHRDIKGRKGVFGDCISHDLFFSGGSVQCCRCLAYRVRGGWIDPDRPINYKNTSR